MMGEKKREDKPTDQTGRSYITAEQRRVRRKWERPETTARVEKNKRRREEQTAESLAFRKNLEYLIYRDHGGNLRDFAAASDVPYSVLHKTIVGPKNPKEQPTREPWLSTIVKVANAGGCSVDWLIGRVDEENTKLRVQVDKLAQEILRGYAKLYLPARRELRRYVEFLLKTQEKHERSRQKEHEKRESLSVSS